ncbi:MAG: hypothetical protein ACE5F6_00300 [Anaerolineae bacterium]
MAMQPIEGQPGIFKDSETGQYLNIRDFRETDKWDTVAVPAGEIVPGTQFIFFADIQAKREADTNIKTPRKLSSGESMVLDRIGLYARLVTGNIVTVPRDIKKVFDNAYYRMKINDLLQDEGPAIKFPSAYGMYGQTTEPDAGIVSIGVPATASASRLVKRQLLNQNHELEGLLRFDPRTWLGQQNPPINYANPVLDEPLLVTNFLHGLVRSAVTK